MTITHPPLSRSDRSHPVRRALRTAACALLAAAVLTLGACATTGVTAPSVVRLTTTDYPPTQVVDILNAPPSVPFERIARLRVDDPTGTATQSQLEAQLMASARSLGANALIVGAVTQSGAAGVAFNPSGGQMQNAPEAGSVSLTATAIRYTH